MVSAVAGLPDRTDLGLVAFALTASLGPPGRRCLSGGVANNSDVFIISGVWLCPAFISSLGCLGLWRADDFICPVCGRARRLPPIGGSCCCEASGPGLLLVVSGSVVSGGRRRK